MGSEYVFISPGYEETEGNVLRDRNHVDWNFRLPDRLLSRKSVDTCEQYFDLETARRRETISARIPDSRGRIRMCKLCHGDQSQSCAQSCGRNVPYVFNINGPMGF